MLSITGAAAGMGIKRLRNREENSEIPGVKWLLYVIVITVIHLLSIRLYYGSGLMAQGRYLYPLLIPLIMFIYGGLSYIERFFKFKRAYLNLSYILFLVLFFLAALVRVVSVFYLEYASPHMGL